MKLSVFVPCLLCILLLNINNATAQINTEVQILKEASVQKAAEEKVTFKKLLQLSKEKGWKMMTTTRDGGVIILTGIDPLGYPIYTTTLDNVVSAATIRTNLLWPGGITGLALNGSSIAKGKLGIWDGGLIRSTHVELAGRINQKDGSPTLNDHSTHVAGTMIATGINPLVKGMSFGAQQLVAYDFTNDLSEMLNEAPNLLISNHSYGDICGWNFNETDNRWDFWGQPNSTEDYKFGYYSSKAQVWDSIAYNAPNYLILVAAGNNRSVNGPAIGAPYWRMDGTGTFVNAGNRPAGISSNDGYDIIPTYATAKNVLTVGAISPIPAGYSILSDAKLTAFSTWGPTDDGRIKPDVVADGVTVLSSISTTDNSYASLSGTSQACAAASGSLFLLQEYYSKLNGGAFMRSATLKGIVIHTADDGGNAGPDYQYGWGVINIQKAAAVITANVTNKSIYENNLVSGGSFTLPVVASGKGPLMVTICWTDPKGAVETTNLLNNPAKKLVSDLDVRVKHGASTTYFPYVLDPNNRSALATTGDNTTDNVEKILIEDAVPGDTYNITVTHKGTLVRGQQAYSLIVSGAGGSGYCASAPTSSAGARIDKVTVGSFSLTNAAGCTSYTNNTGSTISIEPGATVPVTVNVSSCDATTANKIVKVFIDYNNNGNFTDAGENVATSAVLSGTATFTGSFVSPGTLTAGSYTLMRVIVEQTATASDVTPCGSYGNGETQDYRVKIVNPLNDVGVIEIVSPLSNTCANTSQYVSMRIKNFGATDKVNIPVTLNIANGTSSIATINAVCADTIHGYSDVVYTFQTPFSATASTAYTITGSASLTGDQNALNNSITTTVSIGTGSASASGTAAICGTSQVFLNATTTSGVPFWYSSPTSTTPIATGNNTSSTVITTDKTYYLSNNAVNAKVGPANRTVFTAGVYNALSNNFVKFTNSLPLTIQSARLFVGNAGKVTFTVADIVSSNAATGSYIYTVVDSTTIDVYPTATGSTDPGAVFYLNLSVLTPGNHAIIVKFLNGATLYMNTGITSNPYPFTIPNVISITGNSQTNRSDTTNLNYFQQYYFYLYDLEVQLNGCASPRVAIIATTAVAPVITQNGNVFSSNSATGNQWYLNNVPIAGATGQTITASGAGIYTTIVNGGCPSNAINYGTTPVIDLNGSSISLVASPNPNKGKFFLQFQVTGKDDLVISLYNMFGQQVYVSKTPGFTGTFSQQLNTGQTVAGMYILKIQHNKKIYVKKILIE